MNGFSILLKKIILPDCKDRPFVCDGFPCQSEAITIGQNPATVMDGEIWGRWWDDRTGFNFKDFIKKYRQIRRQNGEREMSPTRLRMQRFRDKGVSCVETNVYRNEGAPTAGKGKIPNVDVLALLLDNMPKLRAVIICGGEAKNICRECPEISGKLKELESGGVIRIEIERLYNASYDWIEETCKRIEANRLHKCPRCESDLPSPCLENGSGA